ncbi:MAG: molybdate ABC transporter substrate-binding protein [Candidatus Cryosericum sp.]
MWTRVHRFPRASMVAVLLVAVLACCFSVPVSAASPAGSNNVTQTGVLNQASKVYASASTTSKVMFSVKKGAKVVITGRSGAWFAVSTWLRKTGYIYSKYASILAPVVPATKPVNVSLTISAASSMTDAMNTIKKLYQADHPNVTLTMNYASSGTLEQQIEQGAPADIFISAADKQMDMLEKKGLVLDGTRRILVQNHLVLIVPKGSTTVTGFADLTKSAVKFVAIGEPSSVPAGQYAQETLTKMGLWDQVQLKLVMGKDVRTVLTYVESKNADAGLVYSTDARTSTNVRVVATASEDSHAPIVYPIAVISASKNRTAAKAFEAYLSGAFATAVFRSYGFVAGN